MGILSGLTVIEMCEVYQGPLAGQTLTFQLKVLEVKAASAEEVAHGHAHGAHGHHH